MRSGTPRLHRSKKRAYEKEKLKHSKKLYDIQVLYAYNIRLTYGKERKPYVEDCDRQWKEYCHHQKVKNNIVDLNSDGFLKFAKNKKRVSEFQRQLKIYFPPKGIDKIKNMLSKF